jgi:predicted HTH domain antitoxin
MQIAVELPNDFVAFQQSNQIKREIRLSYALWLFKSGKVTLSKAVEIAGLDIYDFMSACKENAVPVVDIDKQALAEELQGFAAQ